MSHTFTSKKIFMLLFLGIILFSIPHNFAQTVGQSYDTSGFSPIMNDAPCVDLQYDLRPGSRDYYIYGNVMKLQMFLYQNEMMAYPPTGLYANYTFNAVLNFQNSVGLRPTGVVDYYTRMALKKVSCPAENVNTNYSNQNNSNNYNQNNYQYVINSNPVINTQTLFYCSFNGVSYASQSDYNYYCINNNTQIKYTVSFNSNGGSSISSQSILAGYTLPISSYVPTKSGYTFAGWYTDTGLTNLYDFSNPVTSNITLYAKWNEDNTAYTYTVSFQSNGGKSIDSQSVTSGSYAIRPSDPSRSGYNFAGWYTDSGLTNLYDFSNPVTSNITLYAKWSLYDRTSFGAQVSMILCSSSVLFEPVYDDFWQLQSYKSYCLSDTSVSGYNSTNPGKYPVSRDYILVPASNINFGAIKIGEEYYSLTDQYIYQTISGSSYKKYQVSLMIKQ
ncbi:MAG: InlB B-repeat-containing protein [Candidatus Paceibacterota bacterium]